MPDDGSGVRDQRVFAPEALTSRRPPTTRWSLVIAGVLLLVLVKPWGALDEGGPGSALLGLAPTQTPAPTAVATASPTAAPDDTSAICLQPGAWLVMTREVYRASTIRVWTAVEPLEVASGPTDAAIPVVPVVSEGVTALGWCAPQHGPDVPLGPVVIDAWIVDGASAAPIRLARILPPTLASPFGALYVPRGSGVRVWPDGRYVLRYREGDGREHWFAIDIRLRPPLTGLTSPTAVPSMDSIAP